MYMYIYTLTCIYTKCKNIYPYIYLYKYICTYIYLYTLNLMCTYADAYLLQMRVHVHVQRHIHVLIYINVCIYISIHAQYMVPAVRFESSRGNGLKLGVASSSRRPKISVTGTSKVVLGAPASPKKVLGASSSRAASISIIPTLGPKLYEKC